MGAVVQVIAQPVKEVAKAAETVVKPIAKAVEQVGQSVAKTAEAVAKDPLPVLVSVAAQAVGIPAPLTAAAITAAKGGSIQDIALSAGAAYVGGQVDKGVTNALPTDVAQVVKDIVPSAATGATRAAITGQDPLLAALGSGVAGGVAGQVTPELGQTAGTVLGQTAGAVATGKDLEQSLGSSIVSAALSGAGRTAKDIAKDIGTSTEVAQVEQPEGKSMDEVLAEMIAQETNQPSTPSPYAPLASGGVTSDVAPTPLVPTGRVTTEFISPPTPVDALGGGEGIRMEDLPSFEGEEFAAEDFTLPISQEDQQTFDVVQGYAGGTRPAAGGQPTQARQPTPTMGGGGGVSARDQEIIDLINAVNGNQPVATGEGQQTLAGTRPTGGGRAAEEGITGESMGMAEEDLIDTGPREPGEQLPAEGGSSIITVMGPTEAPSRAPRTGIAPSDSALSALLGTSLSESGAGKPIMGEDESKRRAVWNIESLRNALGI
jgi:hypothetical protein